MIPLYSQLWQLSHPAAHQAGQPASFLLSQGSAARVVSVSLTIPFEVVRRFLSRWSSPKLLSLSQDFVANLSSTWISGWLLLCVFRRCQIPFARVLLRWPAWCRLLTGKRDPEHYSLGSQQEVTVFVIRCIRNYQFVGFVLRCIEVGFCSQIRILQDHSSSTRFAHFCTAIPSEIQPNFVSFFWRFKS